jgi:hypothetical protein
MATRIRVTSFIDTVPDGRPGGVPDRDSNGVARRRTTPDGMHQGTARIQLNRHPRKRIAAHLREASTARPPEKVLSAVLAGVAEGNREFGAAFAVASVEYVGNDTGPEEVYHQMARALVGEALRHQAEQRAGFEKLMAPGRDA